MYPDGDVQVVLNSREEQYKRFPACGDPCDPRGAPAFMIQGVQSEGFEGNRYNVLLTGQPFQVTPEMAAKTWLPPEDLYYIPGYEETFEILMHQAEKPEWAQFLEECARRVPRIKHLVGESRVYSTPAATPPAGQSAAITPPQGGAI